MSPPSVHRGLLLLALRRALSPPLLILAAGLGAALWAVDWAPHAELAELAGIGEAGALRRAQTRQGIWSGLVLVLAPLLVYQLAATVPRWRRGEVDWLASAPAGRFSILLSTWLGAALGAALLCVAWGLLGECAAGGGGAFPHRLARRLPGPPVILIEADTPERWLLADPEGALHPEGRVRALLALAGGGPTARVRLSARRVPSGEVVSSERLLSGRGPLELPLPLGEGNIAFALERLGEGSVVVLVGEGLDLLTPTSDPHAAGVALMLRLWLCFCAWLAVALGLGAWMSGATAALGTLAAWVALWLPEAPPSWIPGADLPGVLTTVGRGLVPPVLGPAVWAGTLGCVALGLAVAHLGLRPWRRSA